MRILRSAVIKSPRFSALGPTVPARLLQEALVIFVFKQISQFGSFGKCVWTLCLPEPGSTFARDSTCNSWEELEVSRYPSSRFPRGSEGLRSSTRLSLNSCSRSGKSCNRSLCTSSHLSGIPMILAELPERTAGVSSRNVTVTNKSNSLTYTVASLVCSSPSSDSSMSSWSPTQQSSSPTYWPCACSLRNPLQTLFLPALLLTQPGVPILPRASRM